MSSLAIEGNYVWVVSYGGGLVKIDRISGNKIIYNKANSGLPSNFVLSITIDAQGNNWIGTGGGGLAVYREGGVLNV